MTLLGIISDTHKHLRPEAVEALKACDLIVHAGDIGDPQVIGRLAALAPTVAIRGNIDTGAWASEFAETEIVQVASRRLYVLHNLKDLALDPVAEGFDVVISGHSHKPAISERDGVLYINPGSAGPRRFKLPVTVAKLEMGETLEAEVVDLLDE